MIIRTLPAPNRAGHTFNGWFIQPNLITQMLASTIITGNLNLSARWRFTITFNGNGGQTPNPLILTSGITVGELPRPTRDNHRFLGWATSQSNTNVLPDGLLIEGNATLWARWEVVINNSINRMMDNLARATNLIPQNLRRDTMVIIGQNMLNNGYEAAFVAGMLANVMGEGNFGQFEIAGSTISSNQAYLNYVVDNHNYRTRFSGRHIHDLSAGTLQDLRNIVSNRINTHGNNANLFGLGALQWTNGTRILHLIDNYIREAGGSNRTITREQVIRAENLTLLQQISGEGGHTGPPPGGTGFNSWGFDLYAYWRSVNSNNLNSEAATRNAGSSITQRFVRPHDPNGNVARARGDNAVEIFREMMR